MKNAVGVKRWTGVYKGKKTQAATTSTKKKAKLQNSEANKVVSV